MVKRKIIWSHLAKINLFKILDFYNDRDKSLAFSKKLYQEYQNQLSLAAVNPEMGIKTDIEQIRGLIVRDFIIFYEVSDEQIIVHQIWDTRQDPENLKLDKNSSKK